MLFELRIKFEGDEGDEMAVVDLLETFEWLIESHSVVRLRTPELRIIDKRPGCEGRNHAASD